MPLQELQIYGLWAGKQVAKGTALAAPTHRFKNPSGGMNLPRDDGSINFSDATQFTSYQDWVNTLVGNGNPGLMATPEELSWLLYAFHGGETTSAVTGPPAKTKHTTVPLPGLGHWCTWTTRQGSATVDRMDWVDTQMAQLVVEGSTANKAVLATPSLISIDPGVKRATDPVAAMPTKAGFLYTDGVATFSIDATVFRGHSQFTLTINKDLQPIYSDDSVVYDLALGNAVITIGVTLYFDTDGLAQWNKLLYGSTTPAPGAKPKRTLGALGSYGFTLSPKDAAGVVTGDNFVLTFAGVKWTVPDAPDPNPDGGAGEVALAGSMRKVAGQPDFQIDINNDAIAHTT